MLVVTSYLLQNNTSHHFLVNSVSPHNGIHQGYSRGMFGVVLRLLMLIPLWKLKRDWCLGCTCFMHLFQKHPPRCAFQNRSSSKIPVIESIYNKNIVVLQLYQRWTRSQMVSKDFFEAL